MNLKNYKLTKLGVFLILLLGAYNMKAQTCVNYNEFNKNAGKNINSDADGLRIQMTAAGNIQIYRKGERQIYSEDIKNGDTYKIPGTFHGLYLSIGNTLFTSAQENYRRTTHMVDGGKLTVLSDTCPKDLGPDGIDGKTQKNTIKLKATKDGKDYILTVTYSYTRPDWHMNVDYKIDIPQGNTEKVVLSQGWDTFLSGGDFGPGFIKGDEPNYIMGVYNETTGAYEAFRYKSGVAWAGYYSAHQKDMKDNIDSNHNIFNKLIDPNSSTDNGIGISMDFGSTPGTYSSNSDLVFRCNAQDPSVSSTAVQVCSSTIDLSSLFTGTLKENVVLKWYNSDTNALIADPKNAPVPGNYKVQEYDTQNYCSSLNIVNIKVTKGNCDRCYKVAPTTGTNLDTKFGITALGRADKANWPTERKGAWMALESKERGFVVNRVANPTDIANPIEGMIVYDETAKCLKVYTTKEGATTPAWHCMTKQACFSK